MSRAERRIMLLKYISGLQKPEKDTDSTEIRTELDKIRKYKSAAYQRMNEQQKAGQHFSAKHSHRAYRYCCRYENRLENILDGYEKMKSGKCYFTKDATCRYKSRRDL